MDVGACGADKIQCFDDIFRDQLASDGNFPDMFASNWLRNYDSCGEYDGVVRTIHCLFGMFNVVFIVKALQLQSNVNRAHITTSATLI